MNSSRLVVRSSRALRAARPVRPLRQTRFQSSTTGSSSAEGQSHSTTALYGGLAGGVIAVALGYGWYSFSGVKTAVNTAHQVKSYYESSKQKLQQAAPEPNEALEWLRKQTSFYASFVPGGKQYVDTAFKDLDTVREKHAGEVDKIVKEAYEELKNISSKDLSVSTATEAWQVLQKHVKRIGDLAKDSAHEIMSNHPEIQSKIGANVEQLRSLGDSLGPEANKIVTDTWSQVRDIVAGGGLGAATIAKLKSLIDEKTEQVKKLGEKAWSKGAEELKPYLDKNPKLKELIESNKKELLSGNVTELWSKAKEVATSGNTDDLEKYIKQTVEKAKQKSGEVGGDLSSTFEKYIDQVLPGGAGQLMPKFNQFKEMAQNTDAKGLEELVKETVQEVKDLLEKKLDKGKKLVGESDKKNSN
ncbi:hypothetical protein AMS68_007266 [Peltaster fructicola]|uniref:Uncharacterized protein n=1 Tax=Peltaster fructicola TaxID=286661 RepID=A0A6H0Y4H6_9PEZI|nr:hypothetical protein AMS68_007266 [Peltaster fructicola]